MAEYIEREALLDLLDKRLSELRKQYGPFDHYTDGFDEAVDKVFQLPTADVTEVRHGKWEEHDRYICNSDDKPVAKIGTIYICSECGRQECRMEPYCHCGARMDRKDEG